MKNPFVQELICCVQVGFAVAAVFVGLVLAFDLGHLRVLIMSSNDGMLALALLFFFSGLTFSGAQCVFRNFPLFGDEGEE